MTAPVFWHPDSFVRVVRAYVGPIEEPGFGSIIALGNFGSQRILLKTADSFQHLLLRDRRHVAQVLCRGTDIRTNPFAIELVVDRFPKIESRLRLLKAMADLYRIKRIGGGTGGWTVEAMRHRDALITYDLRQLGWTFQTIARLIYGQKFVDEEWSNPNAALRNRLWRNARRAQKYIKSGYRKLLI